MQSPNQSAAETARLGRSMYQPDESAAETARLGRSMYQPDQSAAEDARLARYEAAASDAEYLQQSDAIQSRRLREFTEARGNDMLVAMRDADTRAQQGNAAAAKKSGSPWGSSFNPGGLPFGGSTGSSFSDLSEGASTGQQYLMADSSGRMKPNLAWVGPNGEANVVPPSYRRQDIKTRDAIDLTSRQLADINILPMREKVESMLGVDWGGKSRLAANSNAIDQLLNKSYGGKTDQSLAYSAAMQLPVALPGIRNYDTSNITYHDYRLEVPLCYRQEAFCTIPNLSPLVDFRSAPKQSWTEPLANGPQTLLGWSPIIHSSDYDKGSFTNMTMSKHPFHSGVVQSNLEWKGDTLYLKTVGYGYGASLPHTAANYAVGVGYFGAWQMGVAYNVDQIRQSQVPQR